MGGKREWLGYWLPGVILGSGLVILIWAFHVH